MKLKVDFTEGIIFKEEMGEDKFNLISRISVTTNFLY